MQCNNAFRKGIFMKILLLITTLCMPLLSHAESRHSDPSFDAVAYVCKFDLTYGKSTISTKVMVSPSADKNDLAVAVITETRKNGTSSEPDVVIGHLKFDDSKGNEKFTSKSSGGTVLIDLSKDATMVETFPDGTTISGPGSCDHINYESVGAHN